MPARTQALPLPFDDAIVVVEGRFNDAHLTIEQAEDGRDAQGRRTRGWVVASGPLSPLLGPVLVPAVPGQSFVRLTAVTESACDVTVVSNGLPAVALLDLFLVDLGPGRQVDRAVKGRMPDWRA